MDIENKFLQITKAIEKEVDATIEQIDNLDVNDLGEIRKNRLMEIKAKEIKQKEWLSNGHGEYNELAEEKQFFDIIKKSENVIIHFFTNTNERSKIVDKHFKILAPKHMETLFVKLNAEKCPFLADKLKVKAIPSIVCIKNSIMIDKLIGFTTLGNCDDFTTADMEWRLAQNEVIEYEGDLSVPPSQQKHKADNYKKIRNGCYNGEDVDFEVDDVLSKSVESKSNAFELTAEEEAELEI